MNDEYCGGECHGDCDVEPTPCRDPKALLKYIEQLKAEKKDNHDRAEEIIEAREKEIRRLQLDSLERDRFRKILCHIRDGRGIHLLDIEEALNHKDGNQHE